MLKALKTETESLKLEVENLKNEIKQLNENTVIESMNDMKVQLQELENNSVPLSTFLSLKNNYKKCYNVSVSVNNINDVIIEELQTIINCNFTKAYKDQLIESSLHSLSIISKIITNHEEWNENDCHCEYH